jgi:hypothetical protein
MNLLSYQRTVFGFHGCDRRLADSVLTGKLKLSASMNTYLRLVGHGDLFLGARPKPGLRVGRATV